MLAGKRQARGSTGRPEPDLGLGKSPRLCPTALQPWLDLGDLGGHHLQRGRGPVGKMGAGPPLRPVPEDSLCPHERVGLGPCPAGPVGCETRGLGGTLAPPQTPTALWGSSLSPSCLPCPCQTPEGWEQNFGGLDARQPLPPPTDDVSPAGATHTAICAQACARGWGPRGLGLPALEQVAPPRGTDRQVEPARLVLGVPCAGLASGARGGAFPRHTGLAAVVGRKLGPSSLSGPSCCHGGLFQKPPGTGHLVQGTS